MDGKMHFVLRPVCVLEPPPRVGWLVASKVQGLRFLTRKRLLCVALKSPRSLSTFDEGISAKDLPGSSNEGSGTFQDEEASLDASTRELNACVRQISETLGLPEGQVPWIASLTPPWPQTLFPLIFLVKPKSHLLSAASLARILPPFVVHKFAHRRCWHWRRR